MIFQITESNSSIGGGSGDWRQGRRGLCSPPRLAPELLKKSVRFRVGISVQLVVQPEAQFSMQSQGGGVVATPGQSLHQIPVYCLGQRVNSDSTAQVAFSRLEFFPLECLTSEHPQCS